MTPVASLWSYEARLWEPGRRSVVAKADGNHEYWLEQSDPLLNTILPGTHVSLVVNFSDAWVAGRTLSNSALLPRMCVIGPVTQSRMLRVGPAALAVGAVVPPTISLATFGVPASELVDRMLPLEDLWSCAEVEQLQDALSAAELFRCASTLRGQLLRRMQRPEGRVLAAHHATDLIRLAGGRLSIDELAKTQGLSRQLFARRFAEAAGLSPKLFARITRFQLLIRTLLSTDVSRWAGASTTVGFYDQAHMINEFRTFAGLAPTSFFRPHGENVEKDSVQARGKPSEWRRRNAS